MVKVLNASRYRCQAALKYTAAMRRADESAEKVQRARLWGAPAVDGADAGEADAGEEEDASASLSTQTEASPSEQQGQHVEPISPAMLMVPAGDGAGAGATTAAGNPRHFSWGSNAFAKECHFWREVGRLGDHVTAEDVCTGVLAGQLEAVKSRMAACMGPRVSE